MVVDDIRRFREAQPFRPYKLVLTSGEELRVDRRAGIAIAPERRFLVYPLEPAGYRVLNPAEVQGVLAAEVTAA